MAFYAGRYLLRHGLPRAGLRVRAEFTTAADPPARVDALRVVITPPPALSAQRHAALLAVASHCTVHNTLRRPPSVGIELEAEGLIT
ncbi:OsmC family protein [Streptomyces sp. CME 23]|nr:OsmC family protein [Streptomyces sp. CME 23]